MGDFELEFEALTSQYVEDVHSILDMFGATDIFIGTHGDTTTVVYKFSNDLRDTMEDFLFHNYPIIHEHMRGV